MLVIVPGIESNCHPLTFCCHSQVSLPCVCALTLVPISLLLYHNPTNWRESDFKATVFEDKNAACLFCKTCHPTSVAHTQIFLQLCGYPAYVFPRMFPFHHSTSTVVLQCHKGREVISKCLCLSCVHRVLWMHTKVANLSYCSRSSSKKGTVCGCLACVFVFPRLFPFHCILPLLYHNAREVISKYLCLSSFHKMLWNTHTFNTHTFNTPSELSVCLFG